MLGCCSGVGAGLSRTRPVPVCRLQRPSQRGPACTHDSSQQLAARWRQVQVPVDVSPISCICAAITQGYTHTRAHGLHAAEARIIATHLRSPYTKLHAHALQQGCVHRLACICAATSRDCTQSFTHPLLATRTHAPVATCWQASALTPCPAAARAQPLCCHAPYAADYH